MRRKVGIGAVKDKKSELDKYSKMGKSMDEHKLSFVQDLMGKFQTSLSEFAAKHRDRINQDPEFRQQFHKMCLSVGVDPLASSKGFWADLLGVGDFYFELGVKIIEVTVQNRAINGGVMEVREVMRILEQNPRMRGHIVPEDIIRAVDKIKILGSGFRIAQFGRKTMIISVPLEINIDHENLMTIAQNNSEGSFTREVLVRGHGWSDERFNMVLQPLLQEGMIWIDIFEGTTTYFFPALWRSASS